VRSSRSTDAIVQKLFDALTARLRALVDQRDDIALVVRYRDEEAVVVLKSMEGIDDASTAEMFWIASDEFHDAASYVTDVVNAFAVKHGAVRMAMERDGMRPWPALPDELLDEARQPVDRLRELMIFSRELLPAPDGFLAAWCLLPLSVADANGYAALTAELLRHDFPLPWCHHMRIYVRGDPSDLLLPATLGAQPRVGWYSPDLSQAAMQRAIDEEAADPSLPLPRRLQNLFISAGIDQAHQRFDDALQKFSVLLKYYAGTRNATMSALALNAVGEIHARLGNVEQAGVCFEQAFVPASRAPGPPIPVMLNIVLNLATLRMSEMRWEEAEAYYDSAQQLATAQRDAPTKLHAIENLGQCQYMQGKVPDALASWHAGAAVAGELDFPEARRSMLQRLASHYASVADYPQHADVQGQLVADAAMTGGPATAGW
jgi:tetratricopeptide (TPR) repeat protein